jgi:8-oxo-dGTP diphosphatase
MEPEKCEAWKWVSWDELRAYEEEQLFLPLLDLFGQRPHFRI